MPKPTLGIIGAGKLGITLAQLGVKAGYRVLIAGSGKAEKIALTVGVLAPGAESTTTSNLAATADVIILALPLGKYTQLTPQLFRNKLVIDAMNYWWEVDGARPELTDLRTSSSERVQAYFTSARIIKAFNHMGYHDLHDGPTKQGDSRRKAIAIAGDYSEDTATVSTIVNDFGFDPVVLGTLHESIWLEPGAKAFGSNITAKALQKLYRDFTDSEKGREVAQARHSMI